MSAIEDAAKPILLPMLRGTPLHLFSSRQRLLSRERRKVIAAWTVKTTMMFLYAWHTPRPSSLFERRWLFHHKEPPPTAQVWIAAYSDAPLFTFLDLAFEIEHDTDPTQWGDGEIATFCIN
jgi:hypothetical protein